MLCITFEYKSQQSTLIVCTRWLAWKKKKKTR